MVLISKKKKPPYLLQLLIKPVTYSSGVVTGIIVRKGMLERGNEKNKAWLTDEEQATQEMPVLKHKKAEGSRSGNNV